MKHGYKIEIIKIYQFTKHSLFKDYVDHFYDKKKNSFGATRQMAKLQLNSLYGIFGRKIDLIKTIVDTPNNELKIIESYFVQTIVKINSTISLFLIASNLDDRLVRDYNIKYNDNIKSSFSLTVKSNVAIASAITAYARIEMIKYKTDNNIDVIYTDTDSLIYKGELSKNLFGDKIGQMKDELNGKFIKEIFVLGIKKYAYLDSDDKFISVFSGLPKNSVTRKDIEDLINYKTVCKPIPNQFFKSLTQMNIHIKEKKVTVKFDAEKQLVDNIYQPIVINDLDTRFEFMKLKFMNKLNKLLKKFRKLFG